MDTEAIVNGDMQNQKQMFFRHTMLRHLKNFKGVNMNITALTKAMLHWVPMGRSGGFRFELFPDVDVEKRDMTSRSYRKRKTRIKMAKESRRRNR